MDLANFAQRELLTRFFASVPERLEAFDVARVPSQLWPNLYLLDVEAEALRVRLTGDRLRLAFGRDLRGLDLRRVIHGPKSDQVHAAYDLAITEGRRAAMRQTVHLKERNLTCFVECAFAPLAMAGRTTRIVGCLFADYVKLLPDPLEADALVILDPA